MSEFWFYKSNLPASSVLYALIGKLQAQEWKATVRCGSVDRMDELFEELWKQPDEMFVGIGKQGCEFEADHRILLTTSGTSSNSPECLVIVGTAAIKPEELDRYKRVMLVFSEDSSEELSLSRLRWKQFANAGAALRLFARKSDKWKMAAAANQQKTHATDLTGKR